MKRFFLTCLLASCLAIPCFAQKKFEGFERGMGIGGWLTNYKRFNVLPEKWRLPLTIGDMEHFDSYITEADVANIASMGMDHIRLGFDQIVLEESPGVYRERTFRCIDNFIGWCEKYQLNVVLNLHKAVGNYCDIQEKVELLDDPQLQDRFVALWVELERRYHDKPAVAFELLNEVRNVNPKKWNDLAERTLQALREKNPTRKIIIGSTCWNSPSTLKDLRLYDDENVIYTFHIYSPFEFTHQRGVLQSGPLYYNRVMAYPSDIEPYRDFQRVVQNNPNAYRNREQMDKNYLRSCLQPAVDFVKAHPDKILWCGEFGTIRHAKIEYRENWMRDVISILKEYKIPYSVWNYLSTPNDGNRFSLVDDDTRKILSPEMLKIIQGNAD
ncbi:MAG: cellulase family glycosylhydrolase [Planctomycetia bacterium]|nr:cellulase family glycosylhydrolase [Planctomycetia bacterium]